MLEYSLVFIFPLMMIFSSFSDLFSMSISNKVSLVLIVAFVIFSLVIGMDFNIQALTLFWPLLSVACLL